MSQFEKQQQRRAKAKSRLEAFLDQGSGSARKSDIAKPKAFDSPASQAKHHIPTPPENLGSVQVRSDAASGVGAQRSHTLADPSDLQQRRGRVSADGKVGSPRVGNDSPAGDRLRRELGNKAGEGKLNESGVPGAITGHVKAEIEDWSLKSVYMPLSNHGGASSYPEREGGVRSSRFDLESVIEEQVGKIAKGAFDAKLADKVLVLSTPAESLWKASRKRKKSQSQEKIPRKCVKLSDIKTLVQSSDEDKSPGVKLYRKLLPLNKLWQAHFEALRGVVPGGKKILSRKNIAESIAKCDLHGAKVLVVSSSKPSHVGSCGLVISETKDTMRIISADGHIRQIPKKSTVFNLVVKNNLVTLEGDSLTRRR